MASSDLVDMDGVVLEIEKGDFFKVKTDEGLIVRVKPSGKVRKNKIKIIVGDRVKVEVSATDLTIGRLSYRYNK